jgi:hypothetical protein
MIIYREKRKKGETKESKKARKKEREHGYA